MKVPRQLRGAAVVTGGASGLGRATVELLKAEGMSVLIADVNEKAGMELAKELGDGAVFRRTDVTDGHSVQEAVEEAHDLHPDGLRISVACAGIGPPQRLMSRRGPAHLEHFVQIITVNLVGTFSLIRSAAISMVKNEVIDEERGVHISTASVAAFEGQMGQVAYAASKAGVVGLTLPSARDLAEYGIRVCTIAPGLFMTPLVDVLPPEAVEALARTPPFPNRWGQPEEYAHLVVAIAQNSMINGETIRLDGALRLPPR